MKICVSNKLIVFCYLFISVRVSIWEFLTFFDFSYLTYREWESCKLKFYGRKEEIFLKSVGKVVKGVIK